MWRLHVLAKHLRDWGLLRVGLMMLDGSWYEELPELDYPEPRDPGGY